MACVSNSVASTCKSDEEQITNENTFSEVKN